KPLQLGDNQVADKVDFSLPRGGIITGRILDEFGEPQPEVQIAAMRRTYGAGGRRQLTPAGRFATTNDLGEYRIYGLAPGQYFLSATLRSFSPFNTSSDDRSGYAPTYYPGTANMAEAQ